MFLLFTLQAFAAQNRQTHSYGALTNAILSTILDKEVSAPHFNLMVWLSES